jgi:hypothetical protein
VKTKAALVPRFSPDVTSAEIENSLKEQLLLKPLVCTRLETKFSTYAPFHVSVAEEDFPLINIVGVWPDGYLIIPFCGLLHPQQVSSSLNSVSGASSVQSVVADKAVEEGALMWG